MEKLSHHSLEEANRDRARFSRHGTGASAGEAIPMTLLEREPVVIATPHGAIEIDLSWDHGQHGKGVWGRLMAALGRGKADLDLGCLYELNDGSKGSLQAFGELYGNYDAAPYIRHSGDERSGVSEGADEFLRINAAHWAEIKRVLIYAYIYEGVPDWIGLRSEISLRCGDTVFELSLNEDRDHLPICALAMLENVNGQVRLTRCGEYFHGHPEMDRAFGFGINWQEGQKS